MNSDSKPKITIAPQVKQRQVAPIQDIFFSKILNIECFILSDKSYISDFILYPKDDAIREGNEEGTMVFLRKLYQGPMINGFKEHERWRAELNKTENWTMKEIEEIPDQSRAEVIQKVKDIFGVDILSIYEKPLVDILYFIAMNYQKRE